jgi:hypothetical protein
MGLEKKWLPFQSRTVKKDQSKPNPATNMRLLYFSLYFSDDSHEFQKHQVGQRQLFYERYEQKQINRKKTNERENWLEQARIGHQIYEVHAQNETKMLKNK